jgi:hypothetical protein
MKKIIVIILTLIIIFIFLGCQYNREPQIQDGEFSIYLEYEIDGNIYVIDDIVVCRYNGFDTTSCRPIRTYSDSLKYKSSLTLVTFEENTESKLTSGRINEKASIRLNVGNGGYYLGDPDRKDMGPYIAYFESYKTEPKVTHNYVTKLTNKQLEEIFGIKIIRFEFDAQIENTFE